MLDGAAMTATITPIYPATSYTYRVLWSKEDQQHVGVCTEFPSLSHLADTHAAALAGILALVTDVIVDLRKQATAVPTPLSIRLFK